MAEYDSISQYRKAAARRLKDAQELSQPPSIDTSMQGADTRHLRGAVYLAGYAVECILKVYIISRVAATSSLAEAIEKRRNAGEEIPNILGAEGHKLLTLLSLTDLEARFGNEERKKDWSLCVKWKSTWRYDPEPPKTADALELVAAVDRIYHWVVSQV